MKDCVSEQTLTELTSPAFSSFCAKYTGSPRSWKRGWSLPNIPAITVPLATPHRHERCSSPRSFEIRLTTSTSAPATHTTLLQISASPSCCRCLSCCSNRVPSSACAASASPSCPDTFEVSPLPLRKAAAWYPSPRVVPTDGVNPQHQCPKPLDAPNLNPKPKTLNPKHQCPKPLNAPGFRFKPKPETRNPKPLTLNPKHQCPKHLNVPNLS